jgi:hypothetical protein
MSSPTTTYARANTVLFAARAKSRAEARLAAAPSSTVIRELAEDVIQLADIVDILCGALGVAEFKR